MEKNTLKRIISFTLTAVLLLGVIPWQVSERAYAKEDSDPIVSAGYMNTMIIKSNGELWGWGYNEYGQLGDGTTESKNAPIKIMDDVIAISTGGSHSHPAYTMAIKSNGELWGWGHNEYGQLGDGTTSNRLTPVKIMNDVANVSTNGGHTMVIKTNGELWGWGYNGNGQLGDGTTTNNITPTKVLTGVVAVSAGDTNTFAIKNNGELWGWGDNGHGQLGNDTTNSSLLPVKIMDNVIAVSSGYSTTIALRNNGELWGWGYNGNGSVGDGSAEDKFFPIKIMDNVAAVSSKYYNTMVVKRNNELWGWGFNANYQLGDGTTNNQYLPIKIMSDVDAVSVGTGYAMAIKTNGELWGWGENRHGQLGDGTTENKSTPVKINFESSEKVVLPQNTSNEIAVYLNGNPIAFDQPSIISNGRTLVPLRAIAEALNFDVTWHQESQMIIMRSPTKRITLQIDNTTAIVDDDQEEKYDYHNLDVPPSIINGRTLVPARFIAEALGCKVDWDESNRSVIITKAEDEKPVGKINIASPNIEYPDGRTGSIIPEGATIDIEFKTDVTDSDIFRISLIHNGKSYDLNGRYDTYSNTGWDGNGNCVARVTMPSISIENWIDGGSAARIEIVGVNSNTFGYSDILYLSNKAVKFTSTANISKYDGYTDNYDLTLAIRLDELDTPKSQAQLKHFEKFNDNFGVGKLSYNLVPMDTNEFIVILNKRLKEANAFTSQVFKALYKISKEGGVDYSDTIDTISNLNGILVKIDTIDSWFSLFKYADVENKPIVKFFSLLALPEFEMNDDGKHYPVTPFNLPYHDANDTKTSLLDQMIRAENDLGVDGALVAITSSQVYKQEVLNMTKNVVWDAISLYKKLIGAIVEANFPVDDKDVKFIIDVLSKFDISNYVKIN